MRKEKKEKNSEEQQKPNTEAEVYDNNKKCDWDQKKRKKKQLKNLIGFLSANKMDNYNREGKKRKKFQNNL